MVKVGFFGQSRGLYAAAKTALCPLDMVVVAASAITFLSGVIGEYIGRIALKKPPCREAFLLYRKLLVYARKF